MNILIIEDEKRTANDLKRTIFEVLPSVQIVGVIGSVEEGIAFLQEGPEPDLIFSDIQLVDGLSFDILQAVNNSVPVIFCTAFDQFALQAFQTYGIDYILKPFDAESVKKALDKFISLKGESTPTDLMAITEAIKQQLYPKRAPASILIHQGDKFIPVSIDDIALFYIKDEMLSARTFDQKRYFVDKKMDNLEASLAPRFFRVNRQQLVNRKAVKEATQYFHRKLLVKLTIPFDEEVVVGKLKVTAFKDWLSGV